MKNVLLMIPIILLIQPNTTVSTAICGLWIILNNTSVERKLSRRMTITKRSVSDFPHKKLSSIEIRGKCIEEILTTEKEYVQHLEDIVEVSDRQACIGRQCMYVRVGMPY